MCLTIESLKKPTSAYADGKIYRWKVMSRRGDGRLMSLYEYDVLWTIGKFKNATPSKPVVYDMPSAKRTRSLKISDQIHGGAIHVYNDYERAERTLFACPSDKRALVLVEVSGFIAEGDDCDEAWKRAKIVKVLKNNS